MASKAASYIHIAPPEHRDAVMASIAEGFRDACQEHGIPIEAGDMAYYVEVVTAKAAEDEEDEARLGGPDAISALVDGSRSCLGGVRIYRFCISPKQER